MVLRFHLWKDKDKIHIAKFPQISISEIVNVFIKEYFKTGQKKYGIDNKLEPWPFQDKEAKQASQEGGASAVRWAAKGVRAVDRELTRAGKFVKGIPDHLNIDSPDGALELCIEKHLRELNDGKKFYSFVGMDELLKKGSIRIHTAKSNDYKLHYSPHLWKEIGRIEEYIRSRYKNAVKNSNEKYKERPKNLCV